MFSCQDIIEIEKNTILPIASSRRKQKIDGLFHFVTKSKSVRFENWRPIFTATILRKIALPSHRLFIISKLPHPRPQSAQNSLSAPKIDDFIQLSSWILYILADATAATSETSFAVIKENGIAYTIFALESSRSFRRRAPAALFVMLQRHSRDKPMMDRPSDDLDVLGETRVEDCGYLVCARAEMGFFIP